MLSMPRIVRPDPSSILGWNLVPPLDRQPCRSIKRNKELRNFLSGRSSSQAANRGRPNSEVDQRYSANQTRSLYGLQRSFYSLGFGYRSCHRRHRQTVDARKRSRRLYHHHAARHRRRLCRHLDRSSFRGRELRRRLDHVDRGRDDFALALPIDFSATRLAK